MILWEGVQDGAAGYLIKLNGLGNKWMKTAVETGTSECKESRWTEKPRCCWSHPTFLCCSEAKNRKLELCPQSTDWFSTHKGYLTWFLFEIHFFQTQNTERLQADRLWSLLAAGSMSQSEKEITWSDGNGNMVWETVSSRRTVRRPDAGDNTSLTSESALLQVL